jgi:hypothetical protein
MNDHSFIEKKRGARYAEKASQFVPLNFLIEGAD